MNTANNALSSSSIFITAEAQGIAALSEQSFSTLTSAQDTSVIQTNSDVTIALETYRNRISRNKQKSDQLRMQVVQLKEISPGRYSSWSGIIKDLGQMLDAIFK